MEYKTDDVKTGYALLHPIVRELCEAVDRWSLEYDKKPITLTESLSTPERDKALKRESPAHSEGRAVDIRTRDWTSQKLTACLKFFNEKYLYLGYLRRSTGKRILMYLHGEGDARHIHLAIGIDVIEKYKKSYPSWVAPVHTKKAVKPKQGKK
jgi:hypothetical protein